MIRDYNGAADPRLPLRCPAGFVERAPNGACVGCGDRIQPRQAWVADRKGPRHLGCRS